MIRPADIREEEGDRLFDEECSRQARIDNGTECPDCSSQKITSTVALGMPLFNCGCGASWFDVTTQPATLSSFLYEVTP